jgi:hypothetical protein
VADPLLRFGGVKRAAQLAFLVFELGFQVGSQFRDDVVLPLPGQVLFHGLKVTIE